MGIRTRRKLLTELWEHDVNTIEAGLQRANRKNGVSGDCEVVFFEIENDSNLHVNVTHTHATPAVEGWAGPAILADGVLHNRRFADGRAADILRDIRAMVGAS